MSENRINLPNGCSLFWEDNGVMGRRYTSDEIGDGVVIWDTSLVDMSTLLAAIVQEETLRIKEKHEKQSKTIS